VKFGYMVSEIWDCTATQRDISYCIH